MPMENKDIFYAVGIAATFLIGLGNIIYNIHINRRTTYINSVTAERVKWINALRENISKFAGLTYNWVISDIEEGSDESKEILKDIDQVRILIQLQLNPNEELSKKIITWIDQVSQDTHESQKEKLKKDLKDMITDVQSLLKEEWNKVKDEAENGRLPEKSTGEYMNIENKNSNALTMLIGAVAGIVTVASSSGQHDLSDTAIGIIITILIWPLIKSKKNNYLKMLVAVVSGLCTLLIVGVLIDIVFGKTPYNVSHFITWVSGSLLFYYCFVPALERKQNKENTD